MVLYSMELNEEVVIVDVRADSTNISNTNSSQTLDVANKKPDLNVYMKSWTERKIDICGWIVKKLIYDYILTFT